MRSLEGLADAED